MNIRKFKLIDANGVWYDLTVHEHFLHTPSGLGFQRDTTYQRLGTRFAVLDDAFAQGQIMGEVFFPHPKAYDKYFEFVRFCQNTPLYLVYNPNGVEYYREVRVSSVEKTELTIGGLNCPITLDCLSLFYKRELINADGKVLYGGKVYNYKYDYRYSTSMINTVEIQSNSYADSPCIIWIYGEAINPIWRHYVNNQLVATGSVNGEIPSGQKLVIDTTKTPYSITRQDLGNRLIADMYAASDFSTERFVFLKHGANRITVSHEGANALQVLMEGHIIYASV